MPARSHSTWSGPLALALALAAANGAFAQQPEIPTPGQAPPGQAQQPVPEGEQVAPGEEPAQAIAPQPAPQAIFGQPGYGIGGFGARPQYLDLDLGAAYTDNVYLTPNDHVGTAIGTAGFDTNYDYIGSNLDIIATGSIGWLKYFDNAFPTTPYGVFDGTAMWGHASDWLQWVVQDTYMEGDADPLAAPTPFFLERVNYFTTGPYLNLNFTGTDRLTFYALYGNLSFETLPFSSQSFDGGATLTHGISASSSIALQLDSAYWSFNNANAASGYFGNSNASSDFDLRSARVVYYTQLARILAAVGAGYVFENYGGSYSGSPLLSLDLTRQISASNSLAVHGEYGYTTFGSSTRANLAAPMSAQLLTGAMPAFATAAPFKDHLITAGWNFARARTTFSLFGSYDRQVYAGGSILPIVPTDESERIFPREIYGPSLFNNQVEGLVAALTRSLRPTLSLGLQASRNWDQFASLGDAKVVLTIVNLSLTKKFRKLGITAYVQRAQQGYSGAAAPLGFVTAAYTENRVGIQFTYDLLGNRAAGALLPAML
jgi:hypothetical protein